MIPSFLSAAAAVFVSAAAFATLTCYHWGPGSHWSGLFQLSALTATLFIFPVWLCVLWPLYRFLPAHSLLWRPPICLLCGVVAGTFLYFLVLGHADGWQFQSFFIHLHFLVGAVSGGTVGAILCAFKRGGHRVA